MTGALVVYSSRTGCAAGVAEGIAETLRDARLTADVTSAEDGPDPAPYDVVVVGSGVRGMRWYAEATRWVESNAETLRGRPVAFFSVGLTPVVHPELADRIAAFTFSLIVRQGINPVLGGNFKGCYEPQRLSLRERTIVKAFGVKPGDYRDWDAIAAWARRVAEEAAARAPERAAGR